MSAQALQLIEANKKTKSTSLDLGNCGLTELPDALWECVWLEELILSSQWSDFDIEQNKWQKYNSPNLGLANGLNTLENLERLPLLKKLIVGGEYKKPLAVSDLTPLAHLSNLQHLQVPNTQVADLTPIALLDNLQILNIFGTEVADLAPIANLVNLQQLQVYNTHVADLTPISQLINLQLLIISNTQVADLAPIANLTNLQQLFISNTRVADLAPIANLVNIQHLNVSSTQVADLAPIANLTNLQQLYVYNTQIANLTPIANLTNLQQLQVHNTSVADLAPIANLSNLQQLHLFNTQVADLAPLAQLTNLQQLYLFNTPVSDISPLAGLPNLKRLDLKRTNVTDLTPLLAHIKGGGQVILKNDQAAHNNEINVFECPLVTPPMAVVQQGNKAILNFYKEIDTAGEEKGLEAKLLLIGEGQAGKTSLRTRLLKGLEVPLPTKTDRTKGLDIEIEQLEFPLKSGETLRLNIFDFGGQDHYKPLHQFFYSYRSLYVLVTRNGDESNDFDFWLDTAQLFGGGSPVVVVNNLFGDVPSQFNRSRYSRFDGILKASVDVNLDKPAKGWSEVKDSIEFWAERLPHIHEFIPKTWASVRRAMQEIRHKNIIPLREFLQLCAQPQHGSMDKARALRCSAYLHDIGFYLHYLDSPLLQQYVIVKNEWATEAVYRVIDDETIGRNSGKFDWDDLRRIWQPRQEDIERGDHFRYEDYQPQLLELMRKFKLCYPLKNEKEFIAPTRLPIRPPEGYAWASKDDLQLFIEYDFMPPGLFSRFIVSRFEDIAGDRLQVWRDGVVFHWKKVLAEAQVLTREGKKNISFRIQGDLEERRIYMSMLDDALDKLHAETPGIKAERKIPCICAGCRAEPEPYFFKRSDLNRFKEKGWLTIQCLQFGDSMEVEKLLGNVFASPKNPNFEESGPEEPETAKTLQIFLSYSHAYREQSQLFFDDFRAYIKIPGLDIQVFDDHEIPLGADWDAFLEGKVEAGTVMLLLVSQEFMNSRYIREKEFGAALNRLKAAGNVLIVPVYFAPCLFEDEADLKALQFFKPHGDEMGEAAKGTDFSYIDLIKFRQTDGQPIFNSNRKHYMLELMKKLRPQLLALAGK